MSGMERAAVPASEMKSVGVIESERIACGQKRRENIILPAMDCDCDESATGGVIAIEDFDDGMDLI